MKINGNEKVKVNPIIPKMIKNKLYPYHVIIPIKSNIAITANVEKQRPMSENIAPQVYNGSFLFQLFFPSFLVVSLSFLNIPKITGIKRKGAVKLPNIRKNGTW